MAQFFFEIYYIKILLPYLCVRKTRKTVVDLIFYTTLHLYLGVFLYIFYSEIAS